MTIDWKDAFQKRENFVDVLTDAIHTWIDDGADKNDVRNLAESLLIDGWVTL